MLTVHLTLAAFRRRSPSLVVKNRVSIYHQPSTFQRRFIAGHADSNKLGGTKIQHSTFIAEKGPDAKWRWNGDAFGNGNEKDELEGVGEGKGKLEPTSSHLFKLILPLGHPSHSIKPKQRHESKTSASTPTRPPTVFLLHPSQPLSHVARLMLSSLGPPMPDVSFRSVSSAGRAFEWSDSTDVGDFVRDAAKGAEFQIVLAYGREPELDGHNSRENEADKRTEQEAEVKEKVIRVQVPTFADRTRYLRRRLDVVEKRLAGMEVIKRECDEEAQRGARRLAIGGFGMLLVYWGTVARLTFWDFGWDIMEPITYLSGLTMVILGYLWFLYQGREVSYSSVLHRSVSSRREGLYHTRGFDLELWAELIGERKALYKEIGRIAEDYGEQRARSGKDDDDRDDGDGIVEQVQLKQGRGDKILNIM